MGRKKLTAGRDPNSPLLCFICGDIARGNNFSVLSCVSCKSFFRRHGLLKTENVQCRYKGKCVITKETRSDCLACRVKKCFECGMDPLMIRCPSGTQTNLNKTQQLMTITNEVQIYLPKPQPLNLLRNDSSTLTSDQWNLLSNIIRSYDEQNVINRVKYLLDERSSLPPKLRLKPADTYNLINQSLQNILPLVEHSFHFRDLSINARRALVLHNVFYTGSFNGCFVARETDAFRNATYMSACSVLFGMDFMMKCARDTEKLVSNGNIIKLMLFVLIFSSNCSVVLFTGEEDIKTMSSSIELIHIQNIYVTMLWKYLVYLYGYDAAVIEYSLLIKNVTDMLIRAEETLRYMGRIVCFDEFVTQTERSLVIQD